jgi:hypothetical protein
VFLVQQIDHLVKVKNVYAFLVRLSELLSTLQDKFISKIGAYHHELVIPLVQIKGEDFHIELKGTNLCSINPIYVDLSYEPCYDDVLAVSCNTEGFNRLSDVDLTQLLTSEKGVDVESLIITSAEEHRLVFVDVNSSHRTLVEL